MSFLFDNFTPAAPYLSQPPNTTLAEGAMPHIACYRFVSAAGVFYQGQCARYATYWCMGFPQSEQLDWAEKVGYAGVQIVFPGLGEPFETSFNDARNRGDEMKAVAA